MAAAERERSTLECWPALVAPNTKHQTLNTDNQTPKNKDQIPSAENQTQKTNNKHQKPKTKTTTSTQSNPDCPCLLRVLPRNFSTHTHVHQINQYCPCHLQVDLHQCDTCASDPGRRPLQIRTMQSCSLNYQAFQVHTTFNNLLSTCASKSFSVSSVNWYRQAHFDVKHKKSSTILRFLFSCLMLLFI